MNLVPVNLATEDELSEVTLQKILLEVGRYAIGTAYRRGGLLSQAKYRRLERCGKGETVRPPDRPRHCRVPSALPGSLKTGCQQRNIRISCSVLRCVRLSHGCLRILKASRNSSISGCQWPPRTQTRSLIQKLSSLIWPANHDSSTFRAYCAEGRQHRKARTGLQRLPSLVHSGALAPQLGKV
jgi:hypothetical protein